MLFIARGSWRPVAPCRQRATASKLVVPEPEPGPASRPIRQWTGCSAGAWWRRPAARGLLLAPLREVRGRRLARVEAPNARDSAVHGGDVPGKKSAARMAVVRWVLDLHNPTARATPCLHDVIMDEGSAVMIHRSPGNVASVAIYILLFIAAGRQERASRPASMQSIVGSRSRSRQQRAL